jgi:general secretion pathway protein K
MTARRQTFLKRYRRQERGMALIFVLGGLIVLSMIAITLLSRAGRDVSIRDVVVDRARAASLVEGAIEAVTLALFEPDVRATLKATSGERIVKIGDHRVMARVRDACALWDVNHGDMTILARLLKAFGAPNPGVTVDALAAAREVDRGLISVEQVRALPGNDGRLHDALARQVTINCRADRIDPEFASPVLLAAIPNLSANTIAAIIEQRRVGPIDPGILAEFSDHLAPGPGQTYEISAAMGFGPGSRVSRRAEITLTHQPGQPYRVLSWTPGE